MGYQRKKSIIILQKEKKGKEYEIRSSDGPLGCAGTTARASIANSFLLSLRNLSGFCFSFSLYLCFSLCLCLCSVSFLRRSLWEKGFWSNGSNGRLLFSNGPLDHTKIIRLKLYLLRAFTSSFFVLFFLFFIF